MCGERETISRTRRAERVRVGACDASIRRMKLASLLAHASLALLLFASACQSTGTGEPAKRRYTLVFLVSGADKTERTKAETAALFRGHMGNIQRLADEGKLYVAGPFGHPIHDDTLRGLCVLATESSDEAHAWMSADPAVQADVMRVESGTFATNAPLARVVELDRAAKAAAANAGRERKMEESIRSYVMLLAQDAARAQSAIRASHAQDKLVFGGTLQSSPRAKYIAVFDAPDVAAAQALFGSSFAELGECELVPWKSADVLVELGAKTGTQ